MISYDMFNPFTIYQLFSYELFCSVLNLQGCKRILYTLSK